MSLLDKYDLLDLIAENETRTYLARERSTVRMVMVHQLLPGPDRISLLELVLRTRMIPTSPGRLQILELGEHGGIPYVVTEIIPGFQSLRQWLLAELAAAAPAPAQGSSSAQAGAWRVPTTGAEEPGPAPAPGLAATLGGSPGSAVQPASPPPVAAPSPRRDPGEFTQLFQAVMVDIHKPRPPSPPHPPSTAPMAAAPPAPPVEEPPPAAAIPPPPRQPMGEFIRLFQQPPESESAPKGAIQEPGEFTRMFQAGWQPSGPMSAQQQPPEAVPGWPVPHVGERLGAVPPPIPSMPSGTGAVPGPEGDEFAKLFEQAYVAPQPAPPVAPGLTPETPLPAPEPLPSGPEPGEFTRMFQSPLAPGPLEPAPRAPAAGVPPSPIPAAPAAFPSGAWPATPAPLGPSAPGSQAGGEFTRIFGSPSIAQETQAPPPSFTGPSTGGATQFFAGVGGAAAPPPTAPATGPGEFTRIVASAPPEETPVASAPTVAAPQSAGAKATRSPYLPLFLILGFVFLVVVALVLYFVLRH